MAFTHGKNTELWLDGLDLSSYFNSLDLSAEVETAETTTFKKSWKTHIPGQSHSSVDSGGFYDPTMTKLRDQLGVSSGAVLTAGPNGLLVVGDQARLVKVLTTTYAESAPIGGAVAFSWGVMADGTVGFGHVLAPLASRTASANGTTFDGLVASANGAVAHLHVASASAADTLDVTIEHSTTGTSGWTTIGTFTTASAAGAERIEIAGTVNRYLRAVWVLTGTDPDFTFGVALARQ